jgi:hypothetical protein
VLADVHVAGDDYAVDGSVDLATGQIALCLEEIGLVRPGIDPRKELPLFDDGIEVNEKLLDVAGNLAADVHLNDGIQLIAGRDHSRGCRA